MLDQLRSGLAVLEAASVTPLCLRIDTDGEWHYYKTVALAGHPSPGNAKNGFSHPTDPGAHRASDCRAWGRLPPLPDTPEAAKEVGRRIGAGLWPDEWSVWVTSDTDGAVRAVTICRRVRRDQGDARLVQMLVEGMDTQSLRKLMQGGRP